MKKFGFLLILSFNIGIQYGYAQEQEKNNFASARVFRLSDPSVMSGYLHQLNNSTISLSSSPLVSSPTVIFHEIDVQDIRKIEFRRKGGGGKRFLIGALSGFAIGGILGFASGGSGSGFVTFSAGETALMTGILGSIGGGLIYGIAGGTINVRINGNKETYYKKNRNLRKYLVVK